MRKKTALFILVMLCISFLMFQVLMPEVLGLLAYRYGPKLKIGRPEWRDARLETDWGLVGASTMGGAAIGGGIGMFFGPVGFLVGMGLGAL